MSSQEPDGRGRLDDEAEAAEPSSTSGGPAAEGRYDPTQGSPGTDHPVGEAYPDEVRVVQALADVATIAILHERNLSQAEVLTEQLQGALNSRVVIEQAKGALAQADGISTPHAFELMRTRARSTRTRLVDVAQAVLADLENSPQQQH